MRNLSKSEIRKLWSQARECRMWAGEQIAKASEAAAEDDCQSFAGYMAEASRLTLLSAKFTKEARAAEAAFRAETV